MATRATSRETLPAPPAGFAHHFTRVDGLRFHHVAGGVADGPPLVLLAGFPESWYAWRRVLPHLGARFRVHAIDLPGQGDSDRPLDGYDTETLARRVHGLVRHLGFTRYGLAAHDVGAWVAFPYGLMFGDEVAALTLMDAGIPGITLPESVPTAPDKAWKMWHFAFHAVADLPELLLEGRERLYLEWFFRAKTADPTSPDPDDIDEYVRILKAPGGLRAALSYYRATAQSAEQNRTWLKTKGKLSMPVLALGADQGSIPDLAAAIRPFATDLRGDVIADSGHFQLEEQPEAVGKALLSFFTPLL